jgi:hypothetical protein
MALSDFIEYPTARLCTCVVANKLVTPSSRLPSNAICALLVIIDWDKHDSDAILLVKLQRSNRHSLAATVGPTVYGIRRKLARVDFELTRRRVRALKLMDRKRAVRGWVA